MSASQTFDAGAGNVNLMCPSSGSDDFYIKIIPTGDFDGTIDNISITKINGDGSYGPELVVNGQFNGGADGWNGKDGLPEGWSYIGEHGGTLPIYTTSLGSALCRVSQDAAFPKFVFGGQDEDNNFALFKKTETYGFHVWRSAVYQVGNPFDLFSIKFGVFPAISGNMEMLVRVYFDNEASSAVSNVIDATNYPDKSSVSLYKPNFTGSLRGQNNFFVELQITGSDLLTVGLPIEIVYDDYPHL